MDDSKMIGGFEVKFKISLAIVFFLLAVILISIYHNFNDLRPLLIYGTATIGGLATVYSAFYIGLTLRVSLNRDTIHRAMELVKEINSIEFSKVRAFLTEEFSQEDIPPKQLYEKVCKKSLRKI